MAYAQKDLKADVIVDMATLTGAQGVATGKGSNPPGGKKMPRW